MAVHDTGKSFVERIGMEDSFAIELVTGDDVHGKPSWTLLLLPSQKVQDLRRALALRDVALEDFGEVLASGEGDEPPEELLEELQGLLTRK